MNAFRISIVLAVATVALRAQVVINEFQYDDSGTDDREFVEIYNAGSAPVDISGWILEAYDEAYPGDNNPDYTIPAGTILAPGGFWVLGAPTVPNVNQIVVFPGSNPPVSTNLWENDKEGMLLKDATGAIQDSVVYEANKIGLVTMANPWPVQFLEGNGIWGNMQSNDGIITSWSRWTDGRDTNDNGADFGLRPATPGATNNIASVLPVAENFDALGAGQFVPNWLGSFKNPRAADPTIATGTNGVNPTAIPPSPQGGLMMTLWDDAGGGDTAHLSTAATSNIRVEAYVFVRAALPAGVPVADHEQWGLGARGTTDSFWNFTNWLPNSTATANNALGATGIAWEYDATLAGASLRLVDEKNGADNETVLLTIPITAGLNDGWQRIRLEVTGNKIDAIFGGTYGSILDGQRYVGTTTTNGVGTIYLGYREFITANINCRPLTLDNLNIRVSPLTADTNTVSASNGQNVNFTLNGGAANANQLYVILASATGGAPGIVLDASQNNTVLPVVYDIITDFGFQNANIDPLFGSFIGFLDGAGGGSATSLIPPLPPSVIGLNLWFGYVVLSSPTQLNGFSSNDVNLVVVP